MRIASRRAPGGGRSSLRGTVGPGGDEPTRCRTKGAADGLDPETIAAFVDERDHLVVGRSSSLAKKAEAALRISFARRASASSRLSLRISSAGLSPPGACSTSWPWRLHHIRSVSSPTPTCGAMARIECERGPPSVAWRSRTIRTARSRSSGVYFLGMFRFSFSWIGTKPRMLLCGVKRLRGPRPVFDGLRLGCGKSVARRSA